MAKKATVKRNKSVKAVTAPPLPIHLPTMLSGQCKCTEPKTRTVRLPHIPQLEWQMVTVACQVCGATFYLTA